MAATESFLTRAAEKSDIDLIQKMDMSYWPEGFKQYERLFQLYPVGFMVGYKQSRAPGLEDIDSPVAGYIAAERLDDEDLRIGYASDFQRSLPSWDHDPSEWHKPNGSVLYIVGHAVNDLYWKHGLSGIIIRDFLEATKSQEGIGTVAVIYNLKHPTPLNPLRFWGKHGFRPMPSTYDPNWKVDGKKETGSMIWVHDIKK